jgi:hypothetical protein
MYLAENSVFLGIANILAVFDISKAVDSRTGEVITPAVEYDGFIRWVTAARITSSLI